MNQRFIITYRSRNNLQNTELFLHHSMRLTHLFSELCCVENIFESERLKIS